MKFWFFPSDCYTICKRTFLLGLVGCCQLNKTVIIPWGLPHAMKTDSSLTRLLFLLSSWSCLFSSLSSLPAFYGASFCALCNIYVHDRHVECSRSSVIPGCSVLTTSGGIAGYGGNRGLLRWWAPPTNWGMRPSSKEGPCQEEAGWPVGGNDCCCCCCWILLFLEYILLLAPLDHVPPLSPARRYTFAQKYLQTPSKNRGLWALSVVVAFFCCFSSKDSHDFPLKRNVCS